MIGKTAVLPCSSDVVFAVDFLPDRTKAHEGASEGMPERATYGFQALGKENLSADAPGDFAHRFAAFSLTGGTMRAYRRELVFIQF